MSHSPLQNYYRTFKTYVRLPSGTSYYTPTVVEFTDSGELGIYAMTGRDETLFKNPDALLNGEAIREVIKSCVPSVKDVSQLLVNDIDVLCVAIKAASYGKILDVTTHCPNCEHQNMYGIDLLGVLGRAKPLEDVYIINLDNGLSVYIRPFNFREHMGAMSKAIQQARFIKVLESDSYSEEEKLSAFSKTYDEISKLTFDMMAHVIVRVVDEANGVNLQNNQENFKYIQEFLANIESTEIKKIEKVLAEINHLGVEKEFNAACENCGHEFICPIDYNPVNFFKSS